MLTKDRENEISRREALLKTGTGFGALALAGLLPNESSTSQAKENETGLMGTIQYSDSERGPGSTSPLMAVIRFYV